MIVYPAGDFDGLIPICGNRDDLEGVCEGGSDCVADVAAYEDPADAAEPDLDEDAAVEENEGDTTDGVGDCVDYIPCVGCLRWVSVRFR